MELTKWRKRIMLIYASILFIFFFLFVLWRLVSGELSRAVGHSPIWSPPYSGRNAVVDTSRLAVEILGVTIVAGVAFVLAAPKNKKESSDK